VKILVYSALLHKSPGSLQTLGTEVVEAPSHATMSSTETRLRSLLDDIKQNQTPEPTPSPTQPEQDDSIAIYLGSFAGIGVFAFCVWDYRDRRAARLAAQQRANDAFGDVDVPDDAELSDLAEPSLSVVVNDITNSEVRIVEVDTDESWSSSRGGSGAEDRTEASTLDVASENRLIAAFQVENLEGERVPLTDLSEKMVKSVLENIGLPSDGTDDSSSDSLTCRRSISDEVVGGFVDQFKAPDGPRVFGIHVVLEPKSADQLSGPSRTATDDQDLVLKIVELQAGVPDLPPSDTTLTSDTTPTSGDEASTSDAARPAVNEV